MPQVTFNEERCKGCSLCVTACPKKIVEMSGDRHNSKGFKVAQCSDPGACIGCAFCAVMCPDLVITVEK